MLFHSHLEGRFGQGSLVRVTHGPAAEMTLWVSGGKISKVVQKLKNSPTEIPTSSLVSTNLKCVYLWPACDDPDSGCSGRHESEGGHPSRMDARDGEEKGSGLWGVSPQTTV